MNQEDIDRARAKVEASMRSFKPQAGPVEQSEQALRRAIKDSNEILVAATTISPLRKNTLTLNRAKLYAEEHFGLKSVSVMSVRIEDVLNIDGMVGPVSGFVKIATRFTAPGKPYSIGPFHRKDVLN